MKEDERGPRDHSLCLWTACCLLKDNINARQLKQPLSCSILALEMRRMR